MSDRISVMVADYFVGIATSLSQTLARWFEVAPSVNSLPQLRGALLTPPRPTVLLLELQFGEENALRILPSLVEAYPEVAFVVHSAHWNEVIVDAALSSGAYGYVHKTMGLLEVRQAIEAAARGRTAVMGPGLSTAAAPPQSRSFVRLAR